LIIFMRSRKYTWTKVHDCLIVAKLFDGGKFRIAVGFAPKDKKGASSAVVSHSSQNRA
jgi:hypothetical protein